MAKFVFNKEAVNDGADNAEGHHVGDFIGHQNAAVLFFKAVGVMPYLVRSYALVIDKGVHVVDLGDFSEPCDPDEGSYLDFVAYHLTFMCGL